MKTKTLKQQIKAIETAIAQLEILAKLSSSDLERAPYNRMIAQLEDDLMHAEIELDREIGGAA